MLRDNLVGLIEPMQISAGADPLALSIQKQASDDRPSCLENPRPERAESSLTENVTSPFQAEPTQRLWPLTWSFRPVGPGCESPVIEYPLSQVIYKPKRFVCPISSASWNEIAQSVGR